MGLRDLIRNITPNFILNLNRQKKKQARDAKLRAQKEKGEVLTEQILVSQFQKMGIKKGDCLMVHSAMSKIGYLQDGPKTLVNALLQVIGKEGTLCMPSSPISMLQLDYIRQNRVFDVNNTPSAMGAITEYFRTLENVKRSCHPTEPVCAFGPLADELTGNHFGEPTPYTVNSPWKKLMEANGKILYIGVTLDNAGTHLHTLEDAVEFKYPVYFREDFEVECIMADGEKAVMKTKVHNPEFSKKRKCDELIPMFEVNEVLMRHKLGETNCLVLDANKMFKTMINQYNLYGITMYTPRGEKIAGYDE